MGWDPVLSPEQKGQSQQQTTEWTLQPWSPRCCYCHTSGAGGRPGLRAARGLQQGRDSRSEDKFMFVLLHIKKMNTEWGGVVRDPKLIWFSTGLEGLCFCLVKSDVPSPIAKSQACKWLGLALSQHFPGCLNSVQQKVVGSASLRDVPSVAQRSSLMGNDAFCCLAVRGCLVRSSW